MNKTNILVAIFCFLLVLTNITLWTLSIKSESSDGEQLELINDSLLHESDKLKIQIDSLISVKNKVDSVIIKIEKTYEKELIDISNQSCASDVLFFSDYISKNSSRLINSNNSSTVKDN